MDDNQSSRRKKPSLGTKTSQRSQTTMAQAPCRQALSRHSSAGMDTTSRPVPQHSQALHRLVQTKLV